jgi:hypothetical protein
VPRFTVLRLGLSLGSDGKKVTVLKELEEIDFLVQVKLNTFEINFVAGNFNKVVLL